MIKLQLTHPSDRPFNLGCTFMRRLNRECCVCVCVVKSTCIIVTMKSIKWVDETERWAQKQTDRCWQIIVKKASLNYSSLKKASIIELQRSLAVLLVRANKLRPGVLGLNELNHCSHGSTRKQFIDAKAPSYPHGLLLDVIETKHTQIPACIWCS